VVLLWKDHDEVVLMWSLPSGAKFLPDVSTSQLRSLYAAEQHPKSKLRLLAAMHRRQGKSIDDIAYMLSKPRRTVHGWLTRFAERGIDAKDARRQTGRPSHLTVTQKRQLVKDLERGPPHNAGLWSTKDVQELLRRKYRVVFVKQHVWRMLDQLGFSMLRPRKQHHQRADAATIAAFKKKRGDWCASTGDDVLSSRRKTKQLSA
jgi:transposase